MESEDKVAREARVKKLWKRLDTRNEGRLDANGLKKGLQEIDHRWCTPNLGSLVAHCFPALKDADSLLQDVLKAIDRDGDRYIQYPGMLSIENLHRRS